MAKGRERLKGKERHKEAEEDANNAWVCMRQTAHDNKLQRKAIFNQKFIQSRKL